MKRFFSLLIAVILVVAVASTNNKLILYCEKPFNFNETMKEDKFKGKKK